MTALKITLGAALALVLVGCAATQTPDKTPPATQPTTRPADAPPPLVLGKRTRVTPDIAYGADPLQKLNVYAPQDVKNAPVLLFVHGGGWTHGDRAEVGSMPKLFNDVGIVLVSIDYRVSPAVQHPEHVNDVAASIKWTRDNISKFGGDPERIVIMGHSAGSHLASFVAIDPRPLARVGLKPSDLRGSIMLDGSAFDIPDRIAKGTEKLAENCRRAFGADPTAQADASPVNHIGRGKGIKPFLFIYVKDGSLNHAQSKTMADKLHDAGVPVTMTRVEGKTHASLVEDLGTTNQDQAGPMIVNFCLSKEK